MSDILKKYGYSPDQVKINATLEKLASNLEALATTDVYKSCFSLMDLTTLKTNDTDESVVKLVEKVNAFKTAYPEWPLPAALCVYPNFASVVKQARACDVNIAVVSACFPSSQSFLEVKLKECEMAIEGGAEEIDIVLSLSHFLAGNYKAASDEIKQVRALIDKVAAKQNRSVHLKVILETGLLSTPENIAVASFLAMEAGADFIKTSTGKVDVNATPVAAFVMCECVKAYFEKTGKKVGFKPAGGMASAQDALCYYSIVANVLGQEWLNKDLFRLGVSRVANSLLSAAEQKSVKFF